MKIMKRDNLQIYILTQLIDLQLQSNIQLPLSSHDWRWIKNLHRQQMNDLYKALIVKY